MITIDSIKGNDTLIPYSGIQRHIVAVSSVQDGTCDSLGFVRPANAAGFPVQSNDAKAGIPYENRVFRDQGERTWNIVCKTVNPFELKP